MLGLGLERVSALYYGSSTTSYPQSGYAIMDIGGGDAGQCGVNFVSKDTAVTAAHCLDGVREVYANIGYYSDNFINTSPSVDYYKQSPNYNLPVFERNPGKYDVGVVKLDDPVSLSEYGKIDTPEAGCNYYLVGYGRNQGIEKFARTGTDVCIKNITDYSFELDFEGNSHFCNGDSGSGIYEKGTNNIVGVVSAFYTSLGSQSCEDGIAYIVARLDYNMDFLQQHIPAAAYAEDQVEVEEEDTVPNDYFGDYYPETKNKDGTYNYNNEIQVEVEKLGEQFDEIYPEDEFLGGVEDDGGSDSGEDSELLPGDPGSDNGEESYTGLPEVDPDKNTKIHVPWITWVLLLGCCVFLPLTVVTVVVILILRRRKK
jgi:hypothetical protein